MSSVDQNFTQWSGPLKIVNDNYPFVLLIKESDSIDKNI